MREDARRTRQAALDKTNEIEETIGKLEETRALADDYRSVHLQTHIHTHTLTDTHIHTDTPTDTHIETHTRRLRWRSFAQSAGLI